VAPEKLKNYLGENLSPIKVITILRADWMWCAVTIYAKLHTRYCQLN
jgi:hypothetical protein